jgi:hypothetical protein
MEAPALEMVRERAVHEHVHAGVVARHQPVDQVARQALTAVFRLHHEGGKLAGSVGVQPYLRDADDAAVVVGHEETRPMKAARIESSLADQRRDVCLVGRAGPADHGRHGISVPSPSPG